MDGRYITEARTAAVSAVSARHLSQTDAGDAGDHRQRRAGAQPPRGLCRGARARRGARLVAATPRSRERFVEEMSGHVSGAPFEQPRIGGGGGRGADLVVLATSSPTPVIEDAWVAPGAHVVSVGACRPDQREMAPELVARARLFVDSRAAALVESGDVVMGIKRAAVRRDHVAGELGEVVLGRVDGPDERRSDHDLQVAGHGGRGRGHGRPGVSASAVETGAGTELTL